MRSWLPGLPGPDLGRLLECWRHLGARLPTLSDQGSASEAAVFFELAGGERALQVGLQGVSLTLDRGGRCLTLAAAYDGTLTVEVEVDARRRAWARLSGLVRASARFGGDPALRAMAALVMEAGARRSLAPAGELPGLIAAAMPRMTAHARGLKLSTQAGVGGALDRCGSLTYLWWDERRGDAWGIREELRATAKLGFTRAARSLRVGVRWRVPTRGHTCAW